MLSITSIVAFILNKYINFVYKTSKIKLIENGSNYSYNDSIVGFWHGESFCNYILFKHIENKKLNLKVIVTKDKRGDYISNFCKYYKVEALRIPDGLKIKSYINYIKEVSKIENSSLAVSLDGPIGPLHQPKKLAFMLSNHSKKDFIKIDTKIKRKKILNKRWDKYIIPLPFNDIIFYVDKIDYIKPEDLNNFKEFKNKFKPIN